MSSSSTTGPVILGLGNPLLDISVDVANLDLCTKYNLKMGNAILADDSHKPLYTELVDTFKDKVLYIAGGATQNSIRVAQWMSGTSGSTAYIGAVGNDAFGKQLKNSAENDGVQALYQITEDKPTGTCAVIVHEQERSLVANLAACETLKESYLDAPEVSAAISSARIMYCAGFPLTHAGGAASVVRLGKHCAENGKIFATNLSAPFIVQFFKDQLSSVLPYTDYVFGNELEAAAYGEANGMPGASLESIALKIASLPKASGTRARIVIITQGAKPTIIAENGVARLIDVAPVPSIVDVNGAGDAFVGGFLAYIAKGATVDAAVKAGQWAAGHVIQHSGCTFDLSAKYTA